MKLSFRQGIVRHQTDSNNNPLFLQSSGTNVTLFVSPDPTIYSISHNVSEYLVTEPVTVNDAWVGPFTPGNQYWLYFDIDITTGIRTFGHTVTEPTAAAVPPLAPVVDQHWFDVATRQMKIWSGTSWRVRVRVFAARYDSTTFTSMSILAPDFRGTQAGLTQPFNSGGIVYDASGRPVRNSNGNFFTTEDLFTANTPSGSSLKINTIIVNATAQEPLAAFQVVQFSDFNEIIHANPFDQNTVVFGILEEDAPTGESVRVVTEGRLTYDQWDWEAAGAEVNDYIYIDNTGMLVLAPVIADQTPVGQVIDLQTIIFRPSVLEAVLDSGGSSDHSTLTNLTNDDHLQYFNEIRGDIRYYPRTELDPILLGKSDVGHVHTKADITDFAHIHTIAQVTNLQPSLDQKINRNGDVMDATANLTFSAGGEILGLPDLPTDDSAAASKFYVDNIPTGDVYTAGTNITFTGSPSAINVEPQGVGSGLDAEYWSNEAININSPVNGEVLTYQAGVWVNAAGGGGGSTSRINDTDNDTYVDTELAADVDTVVIALGDGADDFDAAAVAVFGRSSIDIAALNNGAGVVSGGSVNVTAGNSVDQLGGDITLTAGERFESYEAEIVGGGGQLVLKGGIGDLIGGGGAWLIGGDAPNGQRAGSAYVVGGTNPNGADAGNVFIYGPDASSFAGNIDIHGSDVTGGSGTGGHVNLRGGHHVGLSGNNRGGDVRLDGGDSASADGGDIFIYCGTSDTARGGNVDVYAGPGDTVGGHVYIQSGPAGKTAHQQQAGDINIVGYGNAAGFDSYSGTINITGAESYYDGGTVNITGGYSEKYIGGSININAGDSDDPDALNPGEYTGGDVYVSAGYGDYGGNLTLYAGDGVDEGGNVTLYAGNKGTALVASYGTGGVTTIQAIGSSGVLNLRTTATSGEIFITTNNNDITMTGTVILQRTSASDAGHIRFNDDNNTNYVALQSPASVATNVTYTLPVSPVAGQFLQTDSSGFLSWAAAGGGGTPSRIQDTQNDTFIETDNNGTGTNDTITMALGNAATTLDAGTIFAASPTLLELTSLNSSDGNTSGGIVIRSGQSYDAAGGGSGVVWVQTGDTYGNQATGNLNLVSGDAYKATGATSGNVNIQSGQSYTLSGNVDIRSGYINGSVVGAVSGNVNLSTTAVYSGDTGGINLTTGNITYAGDVGDITLTGGYRSGAQNGTAGSIHLIGGHSGGEMVGGAGNITLTAGTHNYGNASYVTTGTAGSVTITAGDTARAGSTAGSVTLVAGIAPDSVGAIDVQNSDATTPGLVKIYDNDDSHFVGLTAPGAVTTSVTYELPTAPTNNDVLQTTSAGVTSWVGLQYISGSTAVTSATPFAINHNLGQKYVTVSVYDASTDVLIPITAMTLTDANNVSITVGSTTNVRVVVIGVPNVT